MAEVNEEIYSLWMRAVRDQYKEMSNEDIKFDLVKKSSPVAVLISQIQGDFNIGSIIRSANNFGTTKVFYYGKRKYDRRGAVGAYKYLDVIHLPTIEKVKELKSQYKFVALENNISNVQPIKNYVWNKASMIIVGEEGVGIPQEILSLCDDFIEIESRGSVRSLNAAVAASIALYDYSIKF